MYQDLFPHPALRDGVIPRLMSFVDRAMAIARLTQLHILITTSGVPSGQVPAECFPGATSTRLSTIPRRVSFARNNVTILEDAREPKHSPDVVCAPSHSDAMETNNLIMKAVRPDTSAVIVPPPPGYRQFSWPHEDWMVGGDPSIDPGLEFVTGWSSRNIEERSVELPSLPLSPIVVEESDDSVTVQVGSSTDESGTPSGVVASTPPLGDSSAQMTDDTLLMSNAVTLDDFLFKNVLWAPAIALPQGVTRTGSGHTPSRVPQWRLAREGPFLNEQSSSVLRSFGAGGAFWQTTYRASDYALPLGVFGVPLNHPRFLEWVGVPETASILEMGPGKWLDSLSRDKDMAAAIQLHRDVCLITTNLGILDQYAQSLQGAASKMLETSIGMSDYTAADVATGALAPRVHHASMQMESMGM